MTSSTHTELQTTKDKGINFERLLDSLEAASLLRIHPKRVGFHTFRHTYTTLLTQNNEDVKVVQELLRHANSRITLDLYAQAGMPEKRLAQIKVVRMVLDKQPAVA